MFDIGRMCIKIAGRDAGKKCVIIDVIDNTFVMIDGETRRKKCNIKHLEPLDKTIEVSKKASRIEIIRIFKEMGMELKDHKPKKKTERPKQVRKKKEKPVKQQTKQADAKAKTVKETKATPPAKETKSVPEAKKL